MRSKPKSNDAVLIPAGAKYNVVSTHDKPLRLSAIYGPPEHRDGVRFPTKNAAKTSGEHFDGKTTE